ncbi:unnamed protein product, partial [Effrenium voratum]
AEMEDVGRRLRALRKRAARRQSRPRQRSRGWRCAPASSTCMVVLVYSGGVAEVAAEFAQGRGWWKGRRALAGSADELREIAVEVEQAYDTLPLVQIAALHGDPVKAGLVSEPQMLAIIRWVVERSLYTWTEEQNTVHGVAPSRAQLVERALSAIPPLAPDAWLRWGLRLGKLKPRNRISVAEKQSKAMAYFQWVNAASAAAPAHRPPLLINMDETALVRHPSGLAGTVLKVPAGKPILGDPSSLGERRSHITYLASITHDAEVQLRLPQVLIGNERQFSAAMMRSLPTLPANDAWRRGKAASEAGSISTVQWLEILVAGIQAVLPATDWEEAFAAVGAVAEQSRLGRRLCDALEWQQVPTAPDGLPSVEAARMIFPKNMKVNLEALLHQEMETLKQRRAALKRQSKDAAKDQKLLAAKRQRLLKAR